MGKLTDKVAIVTGASKGIGAETARRLASEGAAVVVNYLTGKDGAAEVVGQISAAGGEAFAVRADVTNQDDVNQLVATTKDTYGRVDILVNNAGVYGFGPLDTVTAQEYYRQYDINVLGLTLMTQAALPLFPSTGGSIVNVGSVVSTLAPPGSVIAAGSKAAVDAITKSLAKELGHRNIRVNSINPGIVMTEGFVSGGLAGSEFERNAIALTPLGRIGMPDDIALPIVFLASDDSRWITGVCIIASGGEGI
jgi:3-oxoacyl-[acyl-carrier protein] reductase